MFCPLFAHLERDPFLLALMQKEAKYVECLILIATDLCDYEDQEESWLADDQIQSTVIYAMNAMAEDFVPETLAAVDCISGRLSDQGILKGWTSGF